MLAEWRARSAIAFSPFSGSLNLITTISYVAIMQRDVTHNCVYTTVIISVVTHKITEATNRLRDPGIPWNIYI